ncbi:MAG: phosphate ABC transporter permease PstA [Acidimicrobiia bacterium]|nr:phosphate ABC transporter permease PstA [Acidimicrobiia bacterium]MYB45054.1 phosphate ABC transporter permease PstA [Acidimicrobiia bacterium]MYC86332.1 phosphate ABC transporter permease PstA [Acidimicrobiia bacterium]
MRRRQRRGLIARFALLGALMVAVAALVTLIVTILNSSFGLVAVENERSPEDLVASRGYPAGTALGDLTKEDLVAILEAEISTNLGRRFEREQRFFSDRMVFEDLYVLNDLCMTDDPPPACYLRARSHSQVEALVVERVVEPTIVGTWSFFSSVFNRDEVEAYAAEKHPYAELEFRSWLSWDFVVNPQSPEPAIAGIRTALLGSLWVVLITLVFSFPIGVGAAIYLEEYARESRLTAILQTNINNLAGVPSIIYGMLGLAIFVRTLEAITSGSFLGTGGETTANGRTIVSAGLTLGLLILPIIIINAQEAIRAVPGSLRQAGMALGSTRWQTVRSHVLPNALPGILTGTILAVARALGETAPLVVVGASTFITTDPAGPFSKFTVLPIQIYQWTSRPQDEFRNIAAAAILVLLVLLLTLNTAAVILRNKYSRRTA